MMVVVNSKKLIEKRKEKKLSQHKLSKLAGLSNNAVYRMEECESRVSELRVKAVADILGCSVADICIEQ